MVTGINGYGNYANYANNPYFQQAYQSPNLNAQYYQQQTQTQQPQADTVQLQATQTQATNPNFRGEAAEKKKKGNGKAWAILGTAAAIGAAVLCKKAHGIGTGATWYAKVGNGLKQYGTQALNFVKNNWSKLVTWCKNKLSGGAANPQSHLPVPFN